MNQTDEEKEPKHWAVGVAENIGCTAVLIIGLLLWAASCNVGPWAHP